MKYRDIQVEYQFLEEDAYSPTRNYEGDAGLDFYSYYNVIIKPQTFKVIKTGITVKLPDGFNGLLKPKGKNNHLVGAGVIENNYQGEILFKIFNTSTDSLIIRKGEAIGQMILLVALSPTPVLGRDIHKVETNRGSKGGIKEDEFEKQKLKELGY